MEMTNFGYCMVIYALVAASSLIEVDITHINIAIVQHRDTAKKTYPSKLSIFDFTWFKNIRTVRNVNKTRNSSTITCKS